MALPLPASALQGAVALPTDILRCPVTGGALSGITARELEGINERIRRGDLRHLDGSLVQCELRHAVAASDRRFAYGVIDGIAVLLADLAIVLEERRPPDVGGAMPAAKRAVQAFYDEIGWKAGEGGRFVDSERWEDPRPVSRDYIRKCHERVGRYLKQGGEYLLDVASGPVQYDEYLAYSEGYNARICVDLSFRALAQARNRLGDRGIYILGDIANLPLREGVVDGAVSLHTIYHVPADEQAAAFEEISRVLKPGGAAVVVYNWPSLVVKAALLPARLLQAPRRAIRRLFDLLRRVRRREAPGRRAVERPYFHAYPYRWFVRRSWPFAYEIRVWRSVSVPLLRAYFHRWLLGRAALAALYRMEDRFPRWLGRFGAYPLIVMWRNQSDGGE